MRFVMSALLGYLRRINAPAQPSACLTPASSFFPAARFRAFSNDTTSDPLDNFRSSGMMEEHEKQVAAISAQVRDFREKGVKFRISHGSTNSTRPSATRRDHNVIDLSNLSRVLKVEKESRTALVEPNVPMDRLVEETLKHGLVPPVVMEFPGITVGGGYSGTSGESSSFKHGFFDRTINWVEMILASGEIVQCSRTERADLFHGAAGAAGTLGTTTLVELQLLEAKQFVETTYHPVSDVRSAIAKCRALAADPTLDYLDGILFSPSHGAVITGRLTDAPGDAPIRCFSAASDPWFYQHVRDRTLAAAAEAEAVTEAVPLAEYLFRYDRGGFWVGAAAFDYFRFPFNALTRWWLDDFLHTRMLYAALHASGQSKQFVVQDLAMPFARAEEFVRFVGEEMGIWPLWLCPLRESPRPTLHPHGSEDVAEGAAAMLLNVGVWGKGPTDHDRFLEVNRRMEEKVRELGGMKWLYAHTYYEEVDFWKDFDREWYEGLRQKYGATSLPSLFEKVRVDVEAEKSLIAGSWLMYIRETWPISGIWAIVKAIQSGTYVQARTSTWRWRR